MNTNYHVFYRDVFIFINRLRDLIAKYILVIITNLIQDYLRDEALTKYTAKLSEIELIVLRIVSLN